MRPVTVSAMVDALVGWLRRKATWVPPGASGKDQALPFAATPELPVKVAPGTTGLATVLPGTDGVSNDPSATAGGTAVAAIVTRSIAAELSPAPAGTEKVRVPVAALAVKFAVVTCAKVAEAGVKLPTTAPSNETVTVATPPQAGRWAMAKLAW